MIKFTKPQELNGSQLRKELRDGGVSISDDVFAVSLDDDENLLLEIADQDKAKASEIVAAHIAIDESVIRAAEKAALLNRLGITADEAALLIS
jgi:hypothetical protein